MKPFKIIFALLFIAITLLFFPTDFSDSKNQSTQAKTKTSYTLLKLGHAHPLSSLHHQITKRYAEIIKEKSNGQIQIEIYPNQTLGTDQQMLSQTQQGTIDLVLLPTAKTSGIVPEIQVLDLPFYYQNPEAMDEIMTGPPGQYLLQKYSEHQLMGLSFLNGGFKHLTTQNPLVAPNFLRGQNLRANKNEVIIEQFKALGANPVPIDFSQTKKALKEGVISGQENTITNIYEMKLYEEQKHFSFTQHAFKCEVLLINQHRFQSLSTQQKSLLVEAGSEIQEFAKELTQINETLFLEKMQAAGLLIDTLSEESIEQFTALTQPLQEKAKRNFPEFFQMIKEQNSAKFKKQASEIIIGLNADLTANSKESGQSILRGIALAVDEINQKGGVLNRQFVIEALSNDGISAKGIANMRTFAQTENLAAVFCGIYSPIALAELEIIHEEKLLMLNPWAAATKIVDNGYNPNFVFRLSVRDEYAAPFLVNEALKKYQKIALLLVNDDWGKGNHLAMVKALEKYNTKPVAVEFFNWGEQQMTDQIKRIYQSGAEVILLVAGSREGAEIIKTLAGYQKQIPLLSHWGITGGSFSKQVQKELEVVDLQFLQSFSFFHKRNPRTQALVEAYYKRYGVSQLGDIFAPVGTAHAYELVHLLAKAIEKSNSLDRDQIRIALENLKFHRGIIKDYAPPFSPSNHDALDMDQFFLARFNSEGFIIPTSLKVGAF